MTTKFTAYYLTEKGKNELSYCVIRTIRESYGIMVTQECADGSRETTFIRDLGSNALKAKELAALLAENTVTPTTAQDVVDDFNWMRNNGPAMTRRAM